MACKFVYTARSSSRGRKGERTISRVALGGAVVMIVPGDTFGGDALRATWTAYAGSARNAVVSTRHAAAHRTVEAGCTPPSGVIESRGERIGFEEVGMLFCRNALILGRWDLVWFVEMIWPIVPLRGCPSEQAEFLRLCRFRGVDRGGFVQSGRGWCG